MEKSSDFLAAGKLEWQEGPALPITMDYPCAVTISSTSFFGIFGYDIREFDAAVAGSTSSDGWLENSKWPSLKTWRVHTPGCARLKTKVIIAGGHNGGEIGSTEVLDLVSRQITVAGDLAEPRFWFQLAVISSGGLERVFAVGGAKGRGRPSTVEEWMEETLTWKAAGRKAKRLD